MDNTLINLGAKLNRKRIALCYSGGMDSYLAYQWAIRELKISPQEIICINFDLGQPYLHKEQQAIQEIGIPYVTFKLNLIQEELGNVPSISSYIIPGRNMILASIAAGFGERVWVVGIKFENHHLMYDKNEDFYRVASQALSQSLGTPTIVETPFLEMSKTDALLWALKNGVSQKDLDKTVSCYHPTIKRCGECGLCFKRFIAMEAAGLHEDYSIDPISTETAKSFIVAYKKALDEQDYSHYSYSRIMETFAVAAKHGYSFP